MAGTFSVKTMYGDLLFRNNDDATVDVIIGGLKAGTYQITAHHLNAPNTPSEFDFLVQDADSPSFGQFVGNFAMGLGNPSSFNPTVVTFEVVSNGTDDIILRLDATFIGTGGNTGGWFGFNGLEIEPAPAAAPFILVITPNATAGLYDFQWDSQEGKVYDLLTSTDLVGPITEWPVYDDGETLHEAIPADGETTTLTAVPSADPRRFFAVREYDAPPLLEENFDGAAALPDGWTSNGPVNCTNWEVGVPSGVASGPSAAASEPNCAGTNITGYYTENTDISLVSPSIAIPADTAATLTFQLLIDTDAAGDAGSVRILDADNADTPIPGLEITGLQGLGSSGDGWTANSLVLPADEVGGRNIKVEFRFVSDTGTALDQDVFSGFYIDDVVVTRN